MDEALELCDEGKENFVIGGASVYRQFLPLARKLYLTLIHQKFNADSFFPAIQPEEWEELFRQPGEDKDTNLLFEFIILQRKHYL
jgi:dihydrofolate reductase